jgi:hypothetical protein
MSIFHLPFIGKKTGDSVCSSGRIQPDRNGQGADGLPKDKRSTSAEVRMTTNPATGTRLPAASFREAMERAEQDGPGGRRIALVNGFSS